MVEESSSEQVPPPPPLLQFLPARGPALTSLSGGVQVALAMLFTTATEPLRHGGLRL